MHKRRDTFHFLHSFLNINMIKCPYHSHSIYWYSVDPERHLVCLLYQSGSEERWSTRSVWSVSMIRYSTVIMWIHLSLPVFCYCAFHILCYFEWELSVEFYTCFNSSGVVIGYMKLISLGDRRRLFSIGTGIDNFILSWVGLLMDMVSFYHRNISVGT